MNLLYDTALHLMAAGIKGGALRSEKLALLSAGESRSLAELRAKIGPDDRYVWIHAASLGEFEQGRPLIERIKREQPGLKVLLTFFSPSGYEVRKNFPLADVVAYLPFDTPRRVRAFLDAVHPVMAVFVKYEFWGNYLSELHRRDIPTYIISAIFRPGQIFFRPWGGMFRRMLRCFTRIFVQDERSRSLLAEIGVDNVTVAGDTRFDRVTDIMAGCKPIPVLDSFVDPDKITIVAGSTWPPDEEHLLPWFNDAPGVKLVIAPHEVNPGRLASIEGALTRPCVRLSQTTPTEAAKADCVIIDGFGLLSSAYTYGRIAYVGGGFGAGIHNINEAAVYSEPVIFGPRYHKFKEAVDMIACGGAFTYTTDEEFRAIMTRLTSDPAALKAAGQAAGDYIKAHLGATSIIYDYIFG